MQLNDKNELRRTFKAIRDSLQNKHSKSETICKAFLESNIYKKCSDIFLYYPVKSEVEIELVLNKALLDGKKVAFPMCLNKCGSMEFRYVNSIDDLRPGAFNIKEPQIYCEKAPDDSLSLCVVPAIAYDLSGCRLGYGKGYYDRFLKEFKGISVGFSYDECIIKALPIGEHDQKVNYLITDKNIYNFT